MVFVETINLLKCCNEKRVGSELAEQVSSSHQPVQRMTLYLKGKAGQRK